MTTAPRDPKMAKTIRGLLSERFAGMNERVLYLDREGAVLNDLVWRRNTSGAIRQERERRLGSGELGAVVHVSVALQGSARISVVEILNEVLDDPAQPNVHALISWFDGVAYRHHWIPIPEKAAERWLYIWTAREEEPPGST